MLINGARLLILCPYSGTTRAPVAPVLWCRTWTWWQRHACGSNVLWNVCKWMITHTFILNISQLYESSLQAYCSWDLPTSISCFYPFILDQRLWNKRIALLHMYISANLPLKFKAGSLSCHPNKKRPQKEKIWETQRGIHKDLGSAKAYRQKQL